MSTFDMPEYVKSLGSKTDRKLQHLTNQIGRDGKADLSDAQLAAVNEEIAERKRLGLTFGRGGLHHQA